TSAAGETARCDIAITAADATPPVLTPPPDLDVVAPAPMSETDWLALATATDDCVAPTMHERLVSDLPGCGAGFSRTHELWSTDDCGNESPHELRTYAVRDAT